MDDVNLTDQPAKWIQLAIEQEHSSKKSKKLVETQAHSLARTASYIKQFQYGRVNGYRVLNYAARKGHRLLFDMLLKKLRVDPNLADSLYGTTPLHHAAAGGQIKMIEALIENYLCDIEAPDKGGSTPLCFAIAYDQNASLRKLLDHGASVEVESFLGLPIFMAIYRGNTEAVRMLYMKNPNVLNFEMYDFCTPLVAAASCSSTACFKYLVEVGDVNARPLMYKVISCADSEEKALERIEILLNRGVDPNASYDAVTLFEERPIFCAAKRRWKNLVETLLQSTNRVPGIEWTTEGVIQYVNSEAFGTFHKVTRVLHLKDRLLQEIRANHCLAADLICKVLHVDMDMEEWDLYQSLCEISISYGFQSLYTRGVAATINYLGYTWDKSEEGMLLATKACLALEPDDETFKTQLAQLKEAMGEENTANN